MYNVSLSIIFVFVLFFHVPLLAKEDPDVFYDQESNLQLPISSNMIIDDDNIALIGHYESDSLIKDSRKIVSFKVNNHYYIRGDVLISKGDVSEETCYSSYPTFMSFNSKEKVLPDEILIDGYHFIYLDEIDGAAGTSYGTYIYRCMVNGKCVLFDVHSRISNPYNYLDATPAENVRRSFNIDIETANNIMRNAKFNINK